MDIFKCKISIKDNDLKTVIIGDLTKLDVCNESTLFVETLEGKKGYILKMKQELDIYGLVQLNII